MEQQTNIKVLIAAFLGIFFFGMAFLVLGAVLPSLTELFSLTKGQESTLASCLPLGVLFGSLIFGPVIDRYGYKILLICATAIGIIGLELLAFTNSYPVIVVAVILIGLCSGMLNGSTSAIVSDVSSDKARTSNLFILGLVYCLGA
ncbi:MAG: MFS transporter, partial [Bacteroidales bacterium]